MSKRFFISLTLSVSCALLLIGCGGSETVTTNSSNATAANKTETTTTTTSTPTTTTSTPASTSSGDKVGIPECDDFIAKYEACISSKVPEAMRAQYNASVKQWRDSWRKAAATPQGRAGLIQGCKIIAAQSIQAMTPYGCDF